MNVFKKAVFPALGLSLLLFSCGSAENENKEIEVVEKEVGSKEVLVDAPDVDKRLKPVVIEADIKDPASRTYKNVSDDNEGKYVSSEVEASVAGDVNYQSADMVSGDFDGDGEMEKLVLTSDVKIVDGRPQWDEYNTFQVYIKDGTNIDRLYGNVLQFGSVKVYYSENKNAIHILAKVGDMDNVYEVVYKDGDYRAVPTSEVDAQSKVLKIE